MIMTTTTVIIMCAMRKTKDDRFKAWLIFRVALYNGIRIMVYAVINDDDTHSTHFHALSVAIDIYG